MQSYILRDGVRKKKADHGGFLIDCKKVRERMSAAVGMSDDTSEEAEKRRAIII